ARVPPTDAATENWRARGGRRWATLRPAETDMPPTAGAGHERALRGRGLGEGGALELAQGGAGQGGEQVDAFGALVAGQGGVRVGDEGGLVEGVAGAAGDPRGDLLTPVRVRNPGDGRLPDRGVALQALSAPGGVGVEPAGDDHLLAAAADHQVAGGGVEPADVAGAEPAVGCEGLRRG